MAKKDTRQSALGTMETQSMTPTFFPGEYFVDSDPDPVYTEFFAQYFNDQKAIREEMTNRDVPITEQIALLIGMSKVYAQTYELRK
ncbi:hypothetical protein EAF04_007173 [Stromatinia cepivora]|nr:hypothetical protein EAF04_007173 [Stromatinia cepivora]